MKTDLRKGGQLEIAKRKRGRPRLQRDTPPISHSGDVWPMIVDVAVVLLGAGKRACRGDLITVSKPVRDKFAKNGTAHDA